MTPDQQEFETTSGGTVIRGSSEGSGPDVVLCHGLSATRNYVVHRSRAIPRAGFALHLWDARGHGQSDPSEGPGNYGYPAQVQDLDVVIETVSGDRQVVVGGHSMGCHTAAAWALEHPDRVSALILIGPVYDGTLGVDDRWDQRAEALETGGPEAFAEIVGAELDGPEEAKELVERLALRRSTEHRHPEAVAQALREVPRSRPFEELGDLASIRVPTLVVASRDELDPGHPLRVAETWGQVIPGTELVLEDEGESPLAWQGGKLSREIISFLERAGIGAEANVG